MSETDEKRLAGEIARLLDECRLSHAVHSRKLKELSALRSSSSSSSRVRFFPSFSRALSPLFDFPRRTPGSERTVRFVSAFAAHRNVRDPAVCDTFLEEFLRFLLVAAGASHRSARFRACQIISEIIMLLPDDAEVSDEVWDDVIESMKQRLEDKVPGIRAFAVRALSRFANDVDNADIVNLFLETLPQESSADVRKTIVLSLPPTNATSVAIVESTLDVSESVRRAAYCVLAIKFPMQSLSIKLRTVIIQRGLSDRSSLVRKECLKMLKEEWLAKYCNGDAIALLRFLDVETYETVGESVMEALLKDGVVKVQGQSIRQCLPTANTSEDHNSFQLMEAELALYWKAICKHLQTEAQAKGSDAAATTGTEAEVYASEASVSNDLLDCVLPATVSDFVGLAKAHLSAGPNYRFASRQLLLLGAMLDFSDTSNRKVASAFVHELLMRSLEYEIDDDVNKVVIGDGINLGGDKDWARAVSELAKKVHASSGEFEAVVTGAIEELARPCRERTADFMQWMHCLAVTGLLLETSESLRNLQGKAIGASELLHSLLLPGAKHIHVDVQRVATRCLCLYGLLESRPSEELVKQLRLSFIIGPSSVSIMAAKALVDLATWHGPNELDKSISIGPEQSSDVKTGFNLVNLSNLKEDVNIGLLDLLFSGLDKDDSFLNTESEDQENVRSILAEGFAKFLLLSENYPSMSISLHPLILQRLITLYFSDDTKELQRLKQCLSVFFDHYSALSYSHKKCVSRAFIPVMQSMWPGIYGNSGGSPVLISKMRKRAVQVSRFMLQMMQTPLFAKEHEDVRSNVESSRSPDLMQPSSEFESGEEGLAIRIATEVANCPEKKIAAGKSYIQALCKTVVSLQFRTSEQEAVKCMRGLLNSMIASVLSDKELVKELNHMAAHLKSIDEHPDKELSQEQADAIFSALELDVNFKMDMSVMNQPTPAPRPAKTTAARRRVKRRDLSDDDDDDEHSPLPSMPVAPGVVSARSQSQRASKTAAMSRMSTRTSNALSDTDGEGGSEVTSEESSDESCGAKAV
ncbi:Condensin complex subunit 3 protein [Dioscorea alata]|uniref:Condensin complex subunit 3 protein n=1 Tax=Dioscorea alata TaxID=55571 RepID=A0ACB7U6S4_DIOAL|nr:Condensin complex subunit 3 protein [Dioscorea alata]